jgi:periplasmic protein TonB
VSQPAPKVQSEQDAGSGRLVDAVFRRTVPAPVSTGISSVAVATALHVGLWLLARGSEPPLEAWSADLAARVHAELGRTSDVELLPPPPRPPPASEVRTARAEEAPRPEARSASGARERDRRAAAVSPPAQAGQVVAQGPTDSAVDLTGETFVTGAANAYAGGATASSGMNRIAASTQAVNPGPGSVTHAGARDGSRPVRLNGGEWHCAWPREADGEQIDDQAVMIRVVVGADGSTESATLESDPGHGFGRAAIACAMSTQFSPAQDRDGRPVRAASPPIRVRFTR